MSSYILVYMTAKNEEEAKSIAEFVIGKRLAACANILPGMVSLYHWQGKVNVDKEVVVIFKTLAKAFERLELAIKTKHSYECPCIIAVPIERGHEPYLKWINANVP